MHHGGIDLVVAIPWPACHCCPFHYMQALLAAGACPKRADSNKMTALHWALHGATEERELWRLQVRRPAGAPQRQYAARIHRRLARCLALPQVMLDTAPGLDLDALDDQGMSALHIVALLGELDCLQVGDNLIGRNGRAAGRQSRGTRGRGARAEQRQAALACGVRCGSSTRRAADAAGCGRQREREGEHGPHSAALRMRD